MMSPRLLQLLLLILSSVPFVDTPVMSTPTGTPPTRGDVKSINVVPTRPIHFENATPTNAKVINTAMDVEPTPMDATPTNTTPIDATSTDTTPIDATPTKFINSMDGKPTHSTPMNATPTDCTTGATCMAILVDTDATSTPTVIH